MKRLLIFLVLLIAAAGSYISWLFQRDADGVPILTYYQVNDIDQNDRTLTVEQFDAQMNYLVNNGYNILTPSELLDAWQSGGSVPSNSVVITFDDGHVDAYKNVFPILQKYNVRATFFITTDFINLYPTYLTWDQIREMQASGLVDIESHTLNQRILTEIRSRDKIWDQLYGSKQAIEWYLKKPANFIAYPGGRYSLETEAISKEAGYRAAFTTNYGLAFNAPETYVFDRIQIFGANSHTLLRFKMRLNGAPIIAPLTRMKEQIAEDGNPEVADLIWIP
ncbi:MAG: polysaccharide deacetylase family protein [Selenomonadaceae bacterium]|nr:polysaccharide deacetylase family protein [Selenomonadaceae bacterium]